VRLHPGISRRYRRQHTGDTLEIGAVAPTASPGDTPNCTHATAGSNIGYLTYISNISSRDLMLICLFVMFLIDSNLASREYFLDIGLKWMF
jgi:hypothetical protein